MEENIILPIKLQPGEAPAGQTHLCFAWLHLAWQLRLMVNWGEQHSWSSCWNMAFSCGCLVSSQPYGVVSRWASQAWEHQMEVVPFLWFSYGNHKAPFPVLYWSSGHSSSSMGGIIDSISEQGRWQSNCIILIVVLGSLISKYCCISKLPDCFLRKGKVGWFLSFLQQDIFFDCFWLCHFCYLYYRFWYFF